MHAIISDTCFLRTSVELFPLSLCPLPSPILVYLLRAQLLHQKYIDKTHYADWYSIINLGFFVNS